MMKTAEVMKKHLQQDVCELVNDSDRVRRSGRRRRVCRGMLLFLEGDTWLGRRGVAA